MLPYITEMAAFPRNERIDQLGYLLDLYREDFLLSISHRVVVGVVVVGVGVVEVGVVEVGVGVVVGGGVGKIKSVT